MFNVRSMVDFLKQTPWHRNRDEHLKLLSECIAAEQSNDSGRGDLFDRILVMWPGVTCKHRPVAGGGWVLGNPASLAPSERGILGPQSDPEWVDHEGHWRSPCKPLDMVTVRRMDGVEYLGVASQLNWTEVRQWKR